VLGLSLDEAKNIALVGATAFAILGIAAIWVMKTVVQKVLVAVLLIMLAFAVWSQRESLQECAEQVQANAASDASDAVDAASNPTTTTSDAGAAAETSISETTCTFFGVDVTIP